MSVTTTSPSRAGLVRAAAIYTPLFLLSLGATLAILLGVFDGGIILLILAGIGAFLFGYQSIQSLRDLRAAPVITQGPVTRIWSKMDFFVTRSHYIAVRRMIFRIPLPAYYDLREEAKRMRADGTDEDYRIEVRVEHFPHTGNVIAIDRVGVVPVVEPQQAQA